MLEQVVGELAGRGRARRASSSRVEGDADVDLPLRPRMLRIVAENLAENAIRYAGHGAHVHALDPAQRATSRS